jgi:hypothetical protein
MRDISGATRSALFSIVYVKSFVWHMIAASGESFKITSQDIDRRKRRLLLQLQAGRDAGSADLNARHICSSSRLNPSRSARLGLCRPLMISAAVGGGFD